MEKIADNILKKFQEGKIDRETAAEMLQVVRSQSVGRHDIAVIGMQVDLPGANTLADFWELVVNGANMIHPFPKGRKKGVQWMLSEVQRDFEFKDGSYLNDIEAFDYAYFGISPKEARLMNPSQRVFLQTVIRAIDDAGYGGTKIRNTNTGVFVGYGSDRIVDYKDLIAKTEPEEFATAFTGNLSSIVAGRVSHFLGLNGPAMVMDTTCSSSLVAIDSAVGALQRGQCEMAIAGGVKINIFPLEDGLDEGIDIMSSDGKTYAFDHRAGGTGLGEGSCAVLLKPLADAERDGDHIYAVIKGSAVNHDGHSSGITVPNVKAQEMVLKNAWKAAGIHPEQLVHIEAHGTGTNLGDPIEVEALSRAFKPYTTHKQFCSIASGKANWGHLDNAAGIFSFIKSVLAVKHGIIPPAINFEAPNPHIDFCDSPMYVNELPHILESESRERSYFGVSAFGLSGTNCHVVLGAAPQQIEIPTADRLAVRLLPVSGTDFQAVKRQAQSLHLFLLNNKNVDADALIYTMATGRAHLSCRLMIKFDALEDLVEKLSLISTSEQPVGYEECVYKAPGESRLGDLLLPQDEVLEALASDFLEKGKAAWESYFGDLNLQVVPVPGYVFAPESCWVALPGGESKAKLTGQNRPTTSSEQVLVNALHHALGLTEVSYSDHFFEVGGNSIHALQLANELSEKLQLRITAQDIFEHPTVQELVTLINTKPAKGWDRIQAIESQTPSPISGVQRSMWLTWQMQPESTAYNLVNHFLIKGEFDLKRFKAAVKTVVERHEILRTRFEPSGEFAVQVVNESASFGWQLERSSVNVDATSWKRKLNESSWTKLDLTKGPLLNIALHELSDDHVGLSIEQHHIITDGFSLGVFVRELMTAYVDKSLLSTLPLQYRDYSNWFNQYLDGEEGAADQEYWASKLSTIAVSEYIKPDHQREQVMDAAAGNLSYEFSSEEHENFKNLAAQLGATPYQVYLTILSTLLHKISGENDIVIGSPVNGREGHPALASLIGYFINLVVLKTTVEGNETIVELLQNVKKEVLETQKHQRYPFERMTTLVESDRTSGRHPLFDVQVDFYVPENNAEAAFEKEGFSIEEIEAKIEESKFDVSILMTQNDDYTVLNFVYKKSLYDTSSIQFILDNFCRLLSNVVDNPALRLDQFTIFENEPSSSDESDESLDFNFKFQ